MHPPSSCLALEHPHFPAAVVRAMFRSFLAFDPLADDTASAIRQLAELLVSDKPRFPSASAFTCARTSACRSVVQSSPSSSALIRIDRGRSSSRALSRARPRRSPRVRARSRGVVERGSRPRRSRGLKRVSPVTGFHGFESRTVGLAHTPRLPTRARSRRMFDSTPYTSASVSATSISSHSPLARPFR